MLKNKRKMIINTWKIEVIFKKRVIFKAYDRKIKKRFQKIGEMIYGRQNENYEELQVKIYMLIQEKPLILLEEFDCIIAVKFLKLIENSLFLKEKKNRY